MYAVTFYRELSACMVQHKIKSVGQTSTFQRSCIFDENFRILLRGEIYICIIGVHVYMEKHTSNLKVL